MDTKCFCGDDSDGSIASEVPICKGCYDAQVKQLMDYKKKNTYSDPQINQIIERLYLGNEDASKVKNILQSHGITHIVIAGSYLEAHFPEDYKYKILQIDDFQFQDIKQHFPDSYAFIQDARTTGGTVFVHCAAGVSRSASIVISYLMKLNGWTFQDAHDYVKSKREIICPNSGFKKQLLEYQEDLKKQ